ncbi:hypothetical protein ENSA5_56770 [Enhygromyxa salina]|uniref:FAD-binding domain-containing protein n=1 Tax=Enhygromyxa salina TaxID=215803 RepID=A0A2S9XEG9_9BACT|nr:FAD-dependent monooxygenase [Enhygromyxa salina]PRP91264.1 hypothetical protein ENSA5_56770 [Enhygromyxa salina]
MDPSTSSKPVVIGSSVTGLLISYTLSRSGIDHLLIGGGEPDDRPRLGESLNEITSSDFLCFLDSDLRKHFYQKCHISLMHGKNASMVYLSRPSREGRFRFPREMNDDTTRREGIAHTRSVLHADRLSFDRDLYHRVRANPRCEFIEDLRVQIAHDHTTDQVTGVTLSSGETLAPRYLFDATGPRSLVGRAAGVGRRSLSRPQRVLWTHMRAAAQPSGLDWWQCGTNLLRLDDDSDGLRGIAWTIPIGRTLSLGLSADLDQPGLAGLAADQLLDRLVAAWARRGIDLRSIYPDTAPAQELTHEYCLANRGFGANWLSAGAAYIQVWFPSSSGLNTSLVAAHLAPRLLEDPRGAGEIYEQALQLFLPFHEHMDHMIYAPHLSRGRRPYEFWSRWLSFIPERVAGHLRLSADEIGTDRQIYRILERLSAHFQAHPLLQLGTWGFQIVRPQQCESLEEMASAFGGYFNYRRFRARSYGKGMHDWLGPELSARRRRG